MSARPGRVVREYPIDLPRPRRVMDEVHPHFVELEQTIWRDLETQLKEAGGDETAYFPHPQSGVWDLVILLAALALWEGAAAAGHVDEFFFSRPSLLWAEFRDMVASGTLARHLATTGQEAGLGLLFGGVLGTLAGLGLGWPPGEPGPDAPDDRAQRPAQAGPGAPCSSSGSAWGCSPRSSSPP